MKRVAWFMLAALEIPAVHAQIPGWRANLMSGFSAPAGSATWRDVERFEGYLTAAMPYCGRLTAADYGQYRTMVGTWTGYLAQMNAAARDAQTRAYVVRAWRSAALFPCAFPAGQARPSEAPAPPPQPAPPPFALTPPDVGTLSGADQEQATDLRQRYSFAAAKAATAWNNAEILKISLGLRGMSVNADTSANVARLQSIFGDATEALKAHDWDTARLRLQGAETVTQRIANVVGQ